MEFSEFKNALKELGEALRIQSNELKQALLSVKWDQGRFTKELKKRLKILETHFNNLPRCLVKLAGYGWYLNFWDLEPKETYKIEQILDSNDKKQIDNLMMNHVNKRKDGIQLILIKNYQNRKKPLNCAFEAHNKSEYLLSIPVFLAQVDGLCFESFNEKFFSTENKKPRVGKILTGTITIGTIRNIYIEPLRYLGALNATETVRSKFIGLLNRHEVMHGISNDYGTELNSLQCISLLDYIYGLIKNA